MRRKAKLTKAVAAVTAWTRIDTVRGLIDPSGLQHRTRLAVHAISGLFVFPVLALLVADPADFVLTFIQPFIAVIYLMIFAISWDIVSGYTGQLSLGHAFFFGLGGYSSAILNTQHGLDPLVSIPLAAAIAGIGGLLVGLPAVRLRGPYLSLITLIVPILLLNFVQLWNDELVIVVGPITIPLVPDGFGGMSGLSAIPDTLISTNADAVLTLDSFVTATIGNYYLALITMCLILVALLSITRTTTGDVFKAIRSNEEMVSASGINPVKFKLFAFLLSAIVGGLGGAMFVHSPEAHPIPATILNVQLSMDVIVISLIGGTGTLVGPILGVLFVGAFEFIIQHVLPFFGYSLASVEPVPLLVITLLVIYFMPEGLVRSGPESTRKLIEYFR